MFHKVGAFGLVSSGPPVDWSFLTTNLTIQGGNGGILNGIQEEILMQGRKGLAGFNRK